MGRAASEVEMWARQARLRATERNDARWQQVRGNLIDWEECQRLRAFLAALRGIPDGADVEGSPFSDWLAWAEARVSQLDPLSDPAAIFERDLKSGDSAIKQT